MTRSNHLSDDPKASDEYKKESVLHEELLLLQQKIGKRLDQLSASKAVPEGELGRLYGLFKRNADVRISPKIGIKGLEGLLKELGKYDIQQLRKAKNEVDAQVDALKILLAKLTDMLNKLSGYLPKQPLSKQEIALAQLTTECRKLFDAKTCQLYEVEDLHKQLSSLLVEVRSAMTQSIDLCAFELSRLKGHLFPVGCSVEGDASLLVRIAECLARQEEINQVSQSGYVSLVLAFFKEQEELLGQLQAIEKARTVTAMTRYGAIAQASKNEPQQGTQGCDARYERR